MGALYDSASATLINKLKVANEIRPTIRLIAEWNHNRYAEIQSVVNTGTDPLDEYDNDLFPLSSIVEPDRPEYRGILAAFTSNHGAGTFSNGMTTRGYDDKVAGPRFMTSSRESKYKYWISPNQSAATAPYDITGIWPSVVYKTSVMTNKLMVKLENSYASPDAYVVSITTDGTNWTTVSTNPTINSLGRIELYRQDNGTWSTVVNRNNPTPIRGVRFVATSMATANTRLSIIELGARLESDLSQYVESYEVNKSMSEHSFAAPIGRASSNEGSVSLDNSTLIFSNDNPSSIYYNLLDKNVRFTLDIGINIGTFAAPVFEYVRQFSMVTDSWDGQTYEGTDVSLYDSSTRLQSVKPAPMLFQSMTVGEVIWRILDSVGFSSWNYDVNDLDPAAMIPNFWTDGEKTVWEVIAELSEATQTAIFFDEFDILQIKTRGVAYNLSATPVWQLDAVKNGTKLADIIDFKKTYDYEANVVNINYKPTSISKVSASGVPIMETVWEPEDTVTLRSSQLTKNVAPSDRYIRITPKEAITWPYAGVVQMQGEFMRYYKKGYTYRDTNGSWASAQVASQEEKEVLDKKNPNMAYQNYFNGWLYMKSTAERGIWNTTAKTHTTDLSAWNFNRYRTQGGAVKKWNGGLIHNKDGSSAILRTNKTFSANTWYVSTVGSSGDSTPKYYGTRVRFQKNGAYGAAGIVMSAGTNDSGYFVELVRTRSITANDRAKYTNELCVYVRYSDGTIKRIGPNGGKGVPIEIIDGIYYDLDVYSTTVSGNQAISVAVNGMTRVNITVPAASKPDSAGGRFGMFTRGFTSAEFEYYYASTVDSNPAFDTAGFWDRVKGGFQSGQLDREWIYQNRSAFAISNKAKRSLKTRFDKLFFDEFGPVVHEVREYDIKFTKTPVLYSNVYFSNDAQIICPEYRGDPFGAKFILANASRSNAVVNGEDTTSFGFDNSVEQRFLIYGRTFTQDEQKTETVRDELGVKRRGEITLDIDSDWIQSQAAAKALGAWVVKNWSTGADEVEVEVFGNPLFQLTDMVSANYPIQNVLPTTHKYFIVKVSHSWDNGLTTSLTLRRAKI